MSQEEEANANDAMMMMSTDDVEEPRVAAAIEGPRYAELKESFANALRACVEPPTAQVRTNDDDFTFLKINSCRAGSPSEQLYFFYTRFNRRRARVRLKTRNGRLIKMTALSLTS